MSQPAAATSSLSAALAVFGAGALTPAGGSKLVPALTETVIAHILPTTAPREAHAGLMAILAYMGTAQETRLETWKSYVVTYSFAAFPSLVQEKGMSDVCTFRLIDENTVKALAKFKDDLRAAQDNAAIRVILSNLVGMLGIALTPVATRDQAAQITGCTGLRVLYAHFSLVVFLASKTITDANRAQIQDSRPRAVISAFELYNPRSGLPMGVISTLNGDLKLSPTAHSLLHRAWFELASFRVLGLSPILASVMHGGQIALEVMQVTVAMMKWAQMSHVIFCFHLLSAEPWLETYPPLAPQVQIYKNGAKQLAALADHERDFVRTIYGAKAATLLRRRDIAGLVECAVDQLRGQTTTMAGYFTDPSYAAVVQAFRAEKARRDALATAAAAPAGALAPPPAPPAGPPPAAPSGPSGPGSGPNGPTGPVGPNAAPTVQALLPYSDNAAPLSTHPAPLEPTPLTLTQEISANEQERLALDAEMRATEERLAQLRHEQRAAAARTSAAARGAASDVGGDRSREQDFREARSSHGAA